MNSQTILLHRTLGTRPRESRTTRGTRTPRARTHIDQKNKNNERRKRGHAMPGRGGVCDSDYIHSKNNNTYTGLLGRIRRDPASGDPEMIGVRASRLSSSCCTRDAHACRRKVGVGGRGHTQAGGGRGGTHASRWRCERQIGLVRVCVVNYIQGGTYPTSRLRDSGHTH